MRYRSFVVTAMAGMLLFGACSKEPPPPPAPTGPTEEELAQRRADSIARVRAEEEARRRAEEERRAEEAARKREEARRAEAARKAEEARRADRRAIVELPVHYRERVAGATKMTRRLRNARVMLGMCGIALRKLRWI